MLSGTPCALVALDPDRISQAVEKVAEYDAALAAALRRYAEGFGYTAILSAVEKATAGSKAISD